MKKTMIRLLSVVLVLVVLFSLLPMNVFAKVEPSMYTKNAKLQERLNIILNGRYKPGNFYSKTGKACKCHHLDTDARCYGDCLISPYIDTEKKTVRLGSSQCLGYARYCQRILFGVDEYNNNKKFEKLKGCAGTAKDIKKWFIKNQSKLHIGTHIRVSLGGGHSIVILHVDYKNEKITFLQCNKTPQKRYYKEHNGKTNPNWCKVNDITTLTWKQFARYGKIKYAYVLKDFYNKYPSDNSYKIDAKVVTNSDNVVEIKPSINIANALGYEGNNFKLGIGTKEEVTAMRVSGTKPTNYGNTDTFHFDTVSFDKKAGIFRIKDAWSLCNNIVMVGPQPSALLYYRVCIKVGGYWYQSEVKELVIPAPTIDSANISVTAENDVIGKESGTQVSWTNDANAESYTLVVTDSSGEEIQRIEDLDGQTYELDPIDTAGEYTVSVYANGITGDVVMGDGEATITVMDDVTVQFYDPVTDEVLWEEEIPYGEEANPPASPSHYGYSFVDWDESYDNVTEDLTVNAVFNAGFYTVRFIDSLTNEVLGTAQSVPFGEAATAPNNLNFSQHTADGYAFVGWDKDFSCIEKDTDVYTVFQWVGHTYGANLTLNSATPHEGATANSSIGYDVSCTIRNNLTEKISGRIVAVLKSANGAILTQTDSTAFVVDESTLTGNEMDYTSRTFNFFVKYPLLADKIELYLVNDYAKLGQMSETVVQTIDNGNMTSGWILYEGDCPVQGDNVIIDDNWSETETTTYYRYKQQLTTTSLTAPNGFVKQDGYTLVNAQSLVNEYVAAWPSGFKTSHTLYKTYNKPAIQASETDTQVTVIDSTTTSGYIYWHWCYGEYENGPINRWIEGSKQNGCNTFHAFKRSTPLDFNASAKCYKKSNASVCTDTYWWYGKKVDKEGDLLVKKQNYTVYDKQFTYLSDYSDWIPYTSASEVPVDGAAIGEGLTYNAVETREDTHVWHRYRFASAADVSYEPDPASIVSVSIPVTEDSLIGEVKVWIYKYSQASDFTTEYVGSTSIIEEAGSKRIDLDEIVLREAQYRGGPDYTIAVSAAGYEQAFIIGTIEAPKKLCTVKFYDEFKNLVDEIQVEEGDSIAQEDQPVLTVENDQLSEGKEFVAWQASLSDIRHETLHVYPVIVSRKFTITKVDWNSQTISFVEDCAYGDVLPELSDSPTAVEGYETDWYVKTENGYVTYEDYREQEQTVKSNLLIVSQNTPIVWNVTIIDADYDRLLSDYATGYEIKNFVEGVDDGEEFDDEEPGLVGDGTDTDGETARNISTRDGEIVEEPENSLNIQILSTLAVENAYAIDYSVLAAVEESEDIEFIEWINAADGSVFESTEITQNLVLYPNYVFPYTIDEPYADIEGGEYDEAITVTLTCDSEDAVIWYTINGGDPKNDPNAVMYTGPLTISDCAILKYYATALGCNDSETVETLYAINDGSGEAVKHILTFMPPEPDDSLMIYAPFVVMIDENSTISSVISEFTEVEGYEFEGLYFDVFYTDAVGINDPITSSADIYMNYVLKQYTVTFVDEEENTIDVVTVSHGDPVEAPAYSFEMEGYVFVGWDADLEEVTEDLIVRPRIIAEDEYATVMIPKPGVTLYVGNQLTLSAEITPMYNNGYEIRWSSDDDSVASVDVEGVVTAKSVGTTRIVAELPYTGSKSYCIVKVLYDLDQTLVLMSESGLGFDSDRNLRVTPSAAHTVDDILAGFENANLTVCAADGTVLAGTDLVGTGCVVKLERDEVLLDSATVILTGDYNGDGNINNKDVIMLNQLVLEKREADQWQLLAMDVNGDGYVNNKDCAMLSRYLVGKEIL